MRMTGYGASGSAHDFVAYDSSGNVWNSSAFVAWVDVDFASYRITPTVTATIGGEDRFEADAPAGTVRYELRFRGATAALSYMAWESSVWASQASVDAVAGDVAVLASNSGVASTAPARRAGNRVEVEIVRGDTYKDGLANGALDFDEQSWWPADLTDATITLTARYRRGKHDTTDPAVVLSKTGTVVAATTPQKVRVELTATESAAATVGTHEYDVQATLTTGEVVTLAGPGWPFVVRADQTVPTP